MVNRFLLESNRSHLQLMMNHVLLHGCCCCRPTRVRSLTFWRQLVQIRCCSSKEWSSTVNTPFTSFPQYLKLKDVSDCERELQKSEAFAGLYDWQRAQSWSEEFVLQDGPPYANGKAHMGHAVNRVMKDIILRYKVLRGVRVRFQPGWDCHGLPIELRALSQTEEDHTTMDPCRLRAIAADFAADAIKEQRESFQRWGLMADWSNCYKTSDSSYIGRQMELLAKLYSAGYVYRDLKPIHWSPSSQTALAEAELEYNNNHISRSAYVRLPLCEHPFDGDDGSDIYLLVWTTTPWSLPSNQAVCYSPKLDYVLARFEALPGRYLVAATLCERLSAVFGRRLLETQPIVLDSDTRCRYRSPLAGHVTDSDDSRPLLSADHVTAEQGTGLVHTAPAHGHEDFTLAQSHNIKPVVLVDEKGCYTDQAGDFLAGRSVLTDGDRIVLKTLGDEVVHVEDYRHRYPYDWRTNQPVITLASQQWFIDTSRLLQPALNTVKDVSVFPDTIESSLSRHLKLRTFWCISRQRSWGVPIPAFYDQHHKPIMNAEVIEHVGKLFEQHGYDIWWTWSEADLLPPSLVDHYKQRNEPLPTKGKDIMDIWLDSGSAWFATQPDGLDRAADLCVEGLDQFNAWFLTSLLTSVAITDRSPYKSLLVHGFVVDEYGRKMSKSLGNVVDPDDVIDGKRRSDDWPPRGADCLRLWVASHACGNSHINVSSRILHWSGNRLNKLRNTCRFLLGMQRHLLPVDGTTLEGGGRQFMASNGRLIDRYMLWKLAQFERECAEHYENFRFNRAMIVVNNFIVNDVSSSYLSIVKTRLYNSRADDEETQSTLTVFRQILLTLRQVVAPVLPHLAEELRQHDPLSTETNVFHCGWPVVEHDLDSEALEAVTNLFKLRDAINLLLTNKNGAMFEARLSASSPSSLFSTIQSLHPMGVRCFESQLSEILPVDWVTLTNGSGDSDWSTTGDDSQSALTTCVDGVDVTLTPSNHSKCSRCYRYTCDTDEQICASCCKYVQFSHAERAVH